MEKDEFLDALDQPWMMRKIRLASYSLLFFMLITLVSCSMPRLTIFKDPLTPEEHLNLGVVYEKRKEFDYAIKEHRLAARKLPIAYLYLGNVHFHKEEWAEAEKSYKEAIKRDAKNADAYNNLAWLYYTKGEKMDEAEKLVLKAIELNPSKDDLYRDTLEKIRKAKEP